MTHVRILLSLLVLSLVGCASLSSDEPVLVSGLPAVQGRWIYSHLDEDDTELESKLSACRIVIGNAGLTALITHSGQGMNTVLEVSEETPETIHLNATDGAGISWSYDRIADQLVMPVSSIGASTERSAYFRRG